MQFLHSLKVPDEGHDVGLVVQEEHEVIPRPDQRRRHQAVQILLQLLLALVHDLRVGGGPQVALGRQGGELDVGVVLAQLLVQIIEITVSALDHPHAEWSIDTNNIDRVVLIGLGVRDGDLRGRALDRATPRQVAVL